MEDQKKALTVNQSNQLLVSRYDLPINQMRLILLALSKVNSSKSKQDDIEITVKDFAESFNLTLSESGRTLREVLKSINKNPIYMPDVKNNDNYTKIIHWLKTTHIPDKSDGVFYISFTDEIAPYLFELQKNYSQADFLYLSKLKNTFQIRLYLWLKESLYLSINDGIKTAYESNGAINVSYELDWIKEKGEIKGYTDWHSFKQAKLTPAIRQINAVTDLSVSFEGVRVGKTTQKIQFTFINEHNTKKERPVRPRLRRRPHVTSGSSAHGAWAMDNLKILYDYEVALKQYDPDAQLDIADLKRVIEYNSILGNQIDVAARQSELENRQKK